MPERSARSFASLQRRLGPARAWGASLRPSMPEWPFVAYDLLESGGGSTSATEAACSCAWHALEEAAGRRLTRVIIPNGNACGFSAGLSLECWEELEVQRWPARARVWGRRA